ncbi:hypothetical protein [Limosilactobacillus reuteri]|uniref:hypothetical protein n=1 Tax=Limosilactobacillus reuteri TaxID=1598 RepID=UPI002AAA691C|nr:hypothetical protein [Limosilactobacillus reuteri]WPU43558.1 hypothetical protein SH603_00230 [Limosilactobacillus reuteri]
MTLYNSFAELKADKPELAQELLDVFGKGEWQESNLSVYDTLEDFAYYELTEGWYLDNHLDKQDYNGAPNPIDYIDLEALGEALVESGDESCIYRTEGDQVVTTDWGWG